MPDAKQEPWYDILREDARSPQSARDWWYISGWSVCGDIVLETTRKDLDAVNAAVSACSGVTFTQDDPTGCVRRLVEASERVMAGGDSEATWGPFRAALAAFKLEEP